MPASFREPVLRRFLLKRIGTAAALIGIAAVIGVVTYVHGTDARAFERTAPTVRGRVVGLRPDELPPKVVVRFRVDGVVHRGRAPVYDAARYEAGQPVVVLYDPSDPGSRIEIVGDPYDIGTPATTAGLMLVAGLAVAGTAWRWTRSLVTIAGRAEPTYRMRAITWRRAPTERWWASLQPLDAPADAQPVVSVPLLRGQHVASMPRRNEVLVRGEPRDKALVILRVGAVTLWPRGRARGGARFAASTRSYWAREDHVEATSAQSDAFWDQPAESTARSSAEHREDPGWSPVFMGLLRNVVRPSLAKRTVGGMPILLSMRTTFVAFTIGSLAWIPPVLLFHQEATQPMGWIYLILAGILLALMGIQFLKRSPLDLSTPDALASTYLRRFSKMLAMVDAPGLLGAVISIVTGWWIWYAIGLMATFALRSRIAPTRGRIAAEDLALRAEGRSHPLLEALMLPIDAVRNHDRARRAARKSREHVR